MDLSYCLAVVSPAMTGCGAERAHNLAEVMQGSRDLPGEHRLDNSLIFRALLGKQPGCHTPSVSFHFALDCFYWGCICATFWETETFIQAFCCLVSWLPPQKKATCHFPKPLPNRSVAVFNIHYNCVNMFAERALLACADRLEFKISTVIIFHSLLADGKFHLTCEFACSEIGRRSRWLYKKR